ncbi:L-lysine 6-monooxygenase [Oligella ureolytica]|uniref:lysine N(6)-hydroxylase/L-ornithine N(5)-oxygenase family protein n=1 Tax=Oligella ureolytica TaxID=90244 RepID=UPI000E01B380|nr:SidA/IucD/PvdA family monooxygenase [Oligella ureolytica]SUA54744.1 L-lysine 6-monooxygenase [Oligella ureolytica]
MIYDVAGVGIGPFNLGLSSLLDAKPSIKKIFFEQKPEFGWHLGIMPKWSTLQIPFLADLVTLVDPMSRFSFLNYLKNERRLHRFYIYENFYISREEYNKYCLWVSKQQEGLFFGKRVDEIVYDSDNQLYQLNVVDVVSGISEKFRAKNLVLGTGTQSAKPDFFKDNEPNHCLVNEYSYRSEDLKRTDIITVVGSGQSGAEVFYDLLLDIEHNPYRLQWIGRDVNFMAMDLNKLALEITTPDYSSFFFGLPDNKKKSLIKKQGLLYKGINKNLLKAIYDYIYENYETLQNRVSIYPGVEMLDYQEKNGSNWEILARSLSSDKEIKLDTQAIILALGFEYVEPSFMNGLDGVVNRNSKGNLLVSENYTIDARNTIFVQNVGLEQHGVVTPDLSMGPFRNAVIANQLFDCDYYTPDQQFTFQRFV